MRRHNGRPVILASALPAASVSIVDTDDPGVRCRAMVLCPEPDCDRWAYVQRGVLKPHHSTYKVLCPEPDCGRWVHVHRGLLKPHHGSTDDGHCPGSGLRAQTDLIPGGVTHDVRCPGSRQRIQIDLTPGEHRERLVNVQRTADYRRPARVHLVPTPPVPTPVCRIRTAAV